MTVCWYSSQLEAEEIFPCSHSYYSIIYDHENRLDKFTIIQRSILSQSLVHTHRKTYQISHPMSICTAFHTTLTEKKLY